MSRLRRTLLWLEIWWNLGVLYFIAALASLGFCKENTCPS